MGLFDFFKKKSSDRPQDNGTPALSKAEKKAQKEFQTSLRLATCQYGQYAIRNMEDVAKAYAQGNGVEKNIEKAKDWMEKSIRAKMQQGAYIDDISGPSGYYSVGLLNFFIDGELIPADLDRAEEIAWMLNRNQTIAARDMIKEIYAKKYPDKQDEFNFELLESIDALRCKAKRERSKEVYEEYRAEMKSEGVNSQADEIQWILKKAGYNISLQSVSFPGADGDAEQKFQAARKIEAAGQDFKAAAKAYEPAAEAGHSEAMRRLGLIQRDMISEDACSSLYASGENWLKKAEEAGNTLAAFNLEKNVEDISFIASMAGQGNLDALYILGCIVEKNHWEAAQAIFRNMEALIGDPVAAKNGEGIEWLRTLGQKFGILDQNYYIRLADAGNEIGYAPSQLALAKLTPVMMDRACEQSGAKAGEYGDFGFCQYTINILNPAKKAGISEAKFMADALRNEQIEYSNWFNTKIKEAENGTGTWEYFKNKLSPRERVAKQLAQIHTNINAVYYTRTLRGINYSEIWDRLMDTSYGDSLEQAQNAIASIPEVSKKAASSNSASIGSNPLEDWNEDHNCKNLPSVIYDDGGLEWYKEYAYDTCAVYKSKDRNVSQTITNCSISGRSAWSYGTHFHWY